MPKVQLVVSEEQRDRWDTFTDETPEIDDRSDLIRTAVEQYISTSEEADDPLNTDVLTDLPEDLDAIESRLTTIEDQLKAHRLETPDSEEMENLLEYLLEDHANHVAQKIR